MKRASDIDPAWLEGMERRKRPLIIGALLAADHATLEVHVVEAGDGAEPFAHEPVEFAVREQREAEEILARVINCSLTRRAVFIDKTGRGAYFADRMATRFFPDIVRGVRFGARDIGRFLMGKEPVMGLPVIDRVPALGRKALRQFHENNSNPNTSG